MEKVKVGLLGYGLGGRVFHAPMLHAVQGFVLTKIMTSSNPDSAAQAKALFQEAEIVSQASEIFEDPEIKLVVIATPNPSHFTLAEQALHAGKNVVVDKPMATNLGDAQKLISLAKNKHLVLSAYQNRRWDSDFLTIKKIIKEKRIGKIHSFEAHFDRYRPEIKKGHWKEAGIQGTNILYDLGTHLIDQAVYLFGRPAEVFCDLRSQRNEYIDQFDLFLFYPEVKVRLKAGMLMTEPGPRYQLHGDKGSFVKSGMDPQEEALKNGLLPLGDSNWGVESEDTWGVLSLPTGVEKIKSEVGTYPAFYQNIYEAISTGTATSVALSDTALVAEIIEAAEKSNLERQVINLD